MSTASLRERLAAALYESHHRSGRWPSAANLSRSVWLANADAAIKSMLSHLAERKLRIVPEEATGDMLDAAVGSADAHADDAEMHNGIMWLRAETQDSYGRTVEVAPSNASALGMEDSNNG